MSASQTILIYAELLSNIRQVSVGCSLPTPCLPETRATVSSDGVVLTVNHNGVEASIRLPGRVASTKHLPAQKLGARNISWRLPLATTLAHRVLPAPDEQTVPWSAKDLQSGSPVTCRICRATIVESGTVNVWKDLPSENWAEMMEFWHCHKPDDHGHGHDEGLTSKGYGASSRISAQPGVGFVDLTSFLLSETDIPPSAASNLPVLCESCKSQIGVFNEQDSSVSLFKWKVHVDEQTSRGFDKSPNLSHCISAMLLATMARSGCSKSIILPMKQDQSAQNEPQPDKITQSLLNIWVFNSNISFSSTEETRSPIKAVKVFYRMVSRDEADKLLDSMTSDVQDITLPADAIGKVIDILGSSNTLLPQSDRQLKEWKVGLLEKWDGIGG
ncbi:ubiquitin-conjugating enzyme E2-binding protein [Jackrogersella minutella]|nr:ubiquitin-conjugating enzyme E2-binding protein [Jackrogersella minutella]